MPKYKFVSYNVDDYGTLRVYINDTALLLESEDWLSTPKSEIEKFIDDELEYLGYELDEGEE